VVDSSLRRQNFLSGCSFALRVVVTK
jgi:hypothetical protein